MSTILATAVTTMTVTTWQAMSLGYVASAHASGGELERTMSSSEPIAYTYEADTHCPYHARLRFGRDARGIIANGAVDGEGNEVGAVFEWDDVGSAGLYCGDDLETIRAPYVEPDDGELAAFTMADGDAITRVLEAR